MEKELPKVVLTNVEGTKQVHLISKADLNATVIIPSKQVDIATDNRDNNNAFDFMTVDDLKKEMRERLDPNLNIDTPVINKPINYAIDYSGGIELAPYRLPSLPRDRTITTIYQFSTSPIFYSLVAEIKKEGSNLINLTPEDLLNVGIIGGRDIDYYVRVKVHCNAYSSAFSEPVQFRYAASAYETPKIYKVKLHNRNIEDDGTIIERVYREEQTPTVRTAIEEVRPLTASTQIPRATTRVDYSNTSYFPSNNGLLNYVLHMLGLFKPEFRSIENIPSFAFSYTDIVNRMTSGKKEFISSGDYNVEVCSFTCTYKSGDLTPRPHTHDLTGNSFRTELLLNNTIQYTKNLVNTPNQEMRPAGTVIDISTLLINNVGVIRHSGFYTGSNIKLNTVESDIIYFVNKNLPYNAEEFKGFTSFSVKDPSLKYDTCPISEIYSHIERDYNSVQSFNANIKSNNYITNLTWDDAITGLVGDPGVVNPDPEEIPVTPDTPNKPGMNDPVEDFNPNYDNYDPDTTPYTGRLDLYFSPSNTKIGDPGIPNIVEVEFREATYNTVILKEYPYIENRANMYMHLIPLELLPGYTYSLRFRFKNTANNITSPWSNTRSITIPAVKLFIVDLNLAGKSNGVISNNPTFGITDIASDYDFLDLVNVDPEYINKTHGYYIKLNKIREGNMVYNFSLYSTTGNKEEIFSKRFEKPVYTITNYLYKGILFTLDTFAEGIRVNASTEYKLVAKVEVPDTGISKEDSIKVQTASYSETFPSDNLDMPICTYNRCKFYGEIPSTRLMPDVRFRGYYKIGEQYEINDEVVYLEDGQVEPSLYLCLGKHIAKLKAPNTESNYFVKVDLNTVKDHYRSGLPTYRWLCDKLGIPLMAGNRIVEGQDVIKETYCSDVLNEDGWLKLQNPANNIIYLAKKPIVSNIPYDELRKRFLTGHNSRTIRIGYNYYNVRLLEFNPNSVLDDKFVTEDNGSEFNALYEDRLFELIFARNLVNASLGDMGYSDNENKMYVAGGYTNVTYKDSAISVKSEELNEHRKIYSDRNYYYRPVLELVKESYLPVKIMSNNIPGDKTVQYDRWADVGYFGKVDAGMLLTPKEIKDKYDLSTLDLIEDDIYYHKFYYHGLIIYIPNKPIGNNVTFRELNDAGLIFGTNYKEGDYINGLRFGIMSLDINPNLHEPKDNIPHIESIVTQLLTRINKTVRMNNTFNGYLFSSETDNIDFSDVITKNITGYTEDVKTFKLSKTSVTESNLDDKGSFLPIIFMEACDKNKNLVYNDLDYGTATVDYVDVTYVPTVLEKRTIEKYVPVSKTLTYTEEVLVQVRKEKATGVTSYNKLSKADNDSYGLAISHISKDSDAASMKLLYEREVLNIEFYGKDNNLTMKYGIGDNARYKNFSDYICKSLLANTTSPLLPDVIFISKTFETASSCKAYVRSLILDDISLMSLTNSACKYPNTSTDRTYPLGMIFGSLSSKMSWFPIPRWFNIYNPDLEILENRMNYSPNIMIKEDGTFANSFDKITDIAGKTFSVPLLSPYIPYESYSSEGKELLKKYIMYIIRRERPDITDDKLIEEVDNFYRVNLFSIAGFDLLNLYMLQEDGVIGNGYTAATVQQFDSNYVMPKYFNSVGGETALNKSIVDIYNPVAETKTWYEPGYVTIEKEKEYTDLELRTFEEYVQVQGEPVTIKVPVIRYS